MYIRTYSISYSTTLIIIIITIIIHTIQYILQLYTYQIWYLFTLYCVMWRGYVIHQLLYILHYAILCIYMLIPLWYMTMYITSHTILIYYNNYYYDNYNSYLFFIFIIVLLYVCACMRVYCAVLSLSLSYVYVCSLVCPRICSYMCICVCLPRLTLLDCAVVKRLMCWYRGGIFREKIFTKFGKWVYHVKTDRKSIFDLGKR